MPNLTVDQQTEPLISNDQTSVNPPSHNFSKSILIGILIFVLLSATAYGAYWYGQSVVTGKVASPIPLTTEKASSFSNIPTPKPAPSPVDETVNWKTYEDVVKGVSFKYPDAWEVVKTVPENLTYSLFPTSSDQKQLERFLSSKPLSSSCSIILNNTEVRSTYLMIDLVPSNSDGGWCYSAGYFANTYKRSAKIAGSNKDIEVSKWQVVDKYIFPVTKDNSGTVYTVPWKGDLFESDYIQRDKQIAAIGLYFLQGTDPTAETGFDQILSTFHFLN